jgi:diamine N-acetyltransferase
VTARAGVVRPATEGDLGALGKIGPAAYAAAYAYLWDDQAALASQLDTFRAPAFANALQREDMRVWVAEIDGDPVGFLSLIVNSPNPITQEGNGAEIQRVYLMPIAQRAGLGRKMLEAAVAYARDARFSHVWLDVMVSAEGAIQSYRRWGFVELGSKRFARPVKPELADMLVLRLGL